jgi:hypothetical protein
MSAQMSAAYRRPEEVLYFDALFRYVCKEDQVSGPDGARLFLTSGIDKPTLAAIWRIASSGDKVLSKEKFFLACRLIGLAQSGKEITSTSMLKIPSDNPLPVFSNADAEAMRQSAIKEVPPRPRSPPQAELVDRNNAAPGDELDLECPICLEQFSSEVNIPKLLPCTHDVCDQCIASLASKMCPVCRKPFNSDLGTNRTLLKALRLAKSAYLGPSPVLSPHLSGEQKVCGTHGDMLITYFCWKHQRFVCRMCKETGSCSNCKGDVFLIDKAASSRIEALEAKIPTEQKLKSLKDAISKAKLDLIVVQNYILEAQEASDTAMEQFEQTQEMRKLLKSLKFNLKGVDGISTLQELEANQSKGIQLPLKLMDLVDMAFGSLIQLRNELKPHVEEKNDESAAQLPLPAYLSANTTTTTSPSESEWKVTQEDLRGYARFFKTADQDNDGIVSGKEAKQFFSKSGLSAVLLRDIWKLSKGKATDGCLNKQEFLIVMHLAMVSKAKPHLQLPESIPEAVLDEIDIFLTM